MYRYFGMIFLFLLILAGCKKEEKGNYVSTGEISDLHPTGLTIEGTINQLPGQVTQHGHCYSTSKSPSIHSSKNELGQKSETGTYTSNISGLSPNTTYYIRAYARFSPDTVCYGDEIDFVTEAQTVPEVSTGTVDTDNLESIRLEGILENLGNGITEVSSHGHVWSTSPNPGLSDTKSNLGRRSEAGSYTSQPDDLSPATDYYCKAYATNAIGSSFGEEVMFSTQGFPEVHTLDLYFEGIHTIHVNGEVTDDGGIPDFERGFCYGINPNPTLDDGYITEGAGLTGRFSASIFDLEENTHYYIRAFAKNDYTTVYGDEIEAVTGRLPEMVSISGDMFTMGLDEADADYTPEHQVRISSFKLSIYEITNQEYASFLNETSVAMNGEGYIYLDEAPLVFEDNGTCFRPVAGSENYPVVNVSWEGAQAFCQWAGGQLPTEAQWEYAAREGGNNSNEYSGGNDPGEVAIYWKNADQTEFPVFEGRGPAQVGIMKPNSLGLYDMSGNVWEWCSDWYAAYSYADQTNPEGPSNSTNSKVGRGGSWKSGTDALRVYHRGRNKAEEWPDWHTGSLGFRLAK